MSRVVDLDAWDWLEPSGDIPRGPADRRRRALLVARCIEYGAPLARAEQVLTLIPCPRRPGGSTCAGLLAVDKEDSGSLRAQCPECGSVAARVRGWESTPWARQKEPQPRRQAEGAAWPSGDRENDAGRAGGAAASDEGSGRSALGGAEALGAASATAGGTEPGNAPDGGEPAAPEARARAGDEGAVKSVDRRLEAVLSRMQSSLDATTVKCHIARASAPSKVVELVAGTGVVPDEAALEALCDALIDAWNHTPRAELGGRTPAQVSRAMTMPLDAARMGEQVEMAGSREQGAPCICGSGAPAAQCCAPQFH